MCFSMVSAGFVENINAMPTAKYTKQTISKSEKYGKTKAQIYYQKIQLKGKTKAIKKINKAIQKDCSNFLNSDNTNSLKDCAKYSSEKATYYWRAKSSVKYNKKGIISVRVKTEWWAGGVSNTDMYGFNYYLKTGKKMYINKACRKSKKNTKKSIYNSVKKKVDIQKEDQGALKVIKKKKIKDFKFYIKKNGTVMATFGAYELGAGGWYREYKVGKR